MRLDEVHIWYLPVDRLSDAWLASRADVLSQPERDSAERFHFPQDRRLYRAAHLLVRCALSRCADVPPHQWRFSTGELGKPSIAGPRCELQFNLSHTRGMAACAISRQWPVGVDVEQVRRRDDLPGLAKRYFSCTEAAEVGSGEGAFQTRRFYAYWTLKEAYLKARGAGLSLPLTDVSFRLAPDAPPEAEFVGQIHDDPRAWQFGQWSPGPKHILACAVQCRRQRPVAATCEAADWLTEA